MKQNTPLVQNPRNNKAALLVFNRSIELHLMVFSFFQKEKQEALFYLFVLLRAQLHYSQMQVFYPSQLWSVGTLLQEKFD